MRKFTVEITLGNAAMIDEEDVAPALRQVAASIIQTGRNEGRVMDINGNSVGTWAFTGEES